MKMQEALNIMGDTPKQAGFLVHFQKVVGALLHSGYFPDVDAGEPPIPTENEAWQMAAQFAAKTHKRYINVFVVRREDFTPVPDYAKRQIENR